MKKVSEKGTPSSQTLRKLGSNRLVLKSPLRGKQDADREYGARYTNYGRFSYIDSFVAREFIRHLPKGAKLRFLDVGCCPGEKGAVTTLQAAKKFSKAGAKVEAHGMDVIVPEELARKPVWGVTYHAANIEKDKLPSGSFDVIRAANVLIYAKQPDEALDKISAKLREGGLLIKNPREYGSGIAVYQKRNGELFPLQLFTTETPMDYRPVYAGMITTGRLKQAARRGPGRDFTSGLFKYRLDKELSFLKIKSRADLEEIAALSERTVPRLRADAAAREKARKLFVSNHPAARSE